MATSQYDPNRVYPEDETFTVDGGTMNSISQRILSLRNEVQNLKDAKIQEELADLRIRDKNPSVKDAWDQYQTVLGLARNR